MRDVSPTPISVIPNDRFPPRLVRSHHCLGCSSRPKRHLLLMPASTILSFHTTETPLWLLLQVAPIRNERDLVVLFLLTFRDITALKQPIDSEDTKGGKFPVGSRKWKTVLDREIWSLPHADGARFHSADLPGS